VTATDQILALAAHPAPTAEADAALARFAEAAAAGINSHVARVLRTLRPADDGPAWRAWLSAAAALSVPDGGVSGGGGPGGAVPGGAVRGGGMSGGTAPAVDPAIATVVCAAATALGDDCSAAVAAGLAAAALVEAGLPTAAGWSVPVVSALIGAGLAAGLMLGLPEAQLRSALGICATQAAGLRAAAGTDAAPLQAGKSAFNAVEAAQLARLGFTSSREPLDGRRALFALLSS
jgi:2-methylcitrate dehydratase MmgE/PrpD-like protein